MIYEVEAGAEGPDRAFVVMPNRAMPWPSLVMAFTGIAVLSFMIALYFYFHGAPLVLPFSGLEVLLLGAALYLTAWRSDWREVITIGDDLVTIEVGRRGPDKTFEFKRPWARLVLAKSGGWYPSRLLLRSHGRQVEIGRFLNEEERLGLAEKLAAALGQGLERF